MNKFEKIAIAAPFLLMATQAHSQATVCIGGVCQSGPSSVSVGPTTVYSNGRDTYVNGHKVDPRNPNPLTNPGWTPPQQTVPRPQPRPQPRPTYQQETYVPNTVIRPVFKQNPVTCKISGEVTARFNTSREKVSFSAIDFPSVEEFQRAKTVLADRGYIGREHVSAPACGPIAVKAFSTAIEQNPGIISVSKDLRTGQVSVSFDFQ